MIDSVSKREQFESVDTSSFESIIKFWLKSNSVKTDKFSKPFKFEIKFDLNRNTFSEFERRSFLSNLGIAVSRLKLRSSDERCERLPISNDEIKFQERFKFLRELGSQDELNISSLAEVMVRFRSKGQGVSSLNSASSEWFERTHLRKVRLLI